ncbi:MAG TPA: hypothetical protein VIG66_02745 [Noviherbaspirillum sp.]
MTKTMHTDEIIEELVTAMLGSEAGVRERHLLRENLRSLVRVAKAEQVVDIKASVRRLAGALESHTARRRAKAVLMAQRLPDILEQAQQQFEFKH